MKGINGRILGNPVQKEGFFYSPFIMTRIYCYRKESARREEAEGILAAFKGGFSLGGLMKVATGEITQVIDD